MSEDHEGKGLFSIDETHNRRMLEVYSGTSPAELIALDLMRLASAVTCCWSSIQKLEARHAPDMASLANRARVLLSFRPVENAYTSKIEHHVWHLLEDLVAASEKEKG